MVHHYILQNSGQEDDADDLFAESIVALVQQIVDQKYRGEASVRTYTMQIVRYKWLNRLRARKPTVAYEDHMAEAVRPDFEDLPQGHRDERLELAVAELMEQIDAQCRQFFHHRYWIKQSMEAVAKVMGFKNAQIAKNKHQKCLKKLRELMQDRTDLNDLLGGVS